MRQDPHVSPACVHRAGKVFDLSRPGVSRGLQLTLMTLGSVNRGRFWVAALDSGRSGTQRGDMAESAKAIVKQALDKLPDNATVEEALERILFLSQIEKGLAEADSGKTLSSEEVRNRLGL